MQTMLHKSRKGMTLLETVIALLILSLAVNVMSKLTSTRIAETEMMDSQYVMLHVDALLAEMYNDFHRCQKFYVVGGDDPYAVPDDGSGDEEDEAEVDPSSMVVFEMGAEGAIVYQYIWDDAKSIGTLYRDGVKMFNCRDFQVRGLANNLYVGVRIDGDKRLEMDIFK